jgi:stalled ribosome rescue protein Dom34
MESYSAAGGRSKVFTVVFNHNDKDLYLIADMVKDYGAEEIVFVKSNRFYKRDVYNFVDELGKQQALHPSNISDDTGIFWRSLDLTDSKDMERIARATTTKEQV